MLVAAPTQPSHPVGPRIFFSFFSKVTKIENLLLRLICDLISSQKCVVGLCPSKIKSKLLVHLKTNFMTKKLDYIKYCLECLLTKQRNLTITTSTFLFQ